MHAAHERITYERLKQGLARDGIKTQALLVPVSVHVSEREADLAEQHATALDELGIACDRSGPQSLLVRRVPTLLQGGDIPALIKDVLSDLATEGQQYASSRIRRGVVKHGLPWLGACQPAPGAGRNERPAARHGGD